MTPTRVISGQAARAVLARSFAQSVQAIGLSLGPARRGIVYDLPSGRPGMAQGGFSIARQTSAESGPWSVAPRILKETLWEAQRDLGDGTTRLACMAEAIYSAAVLSVAQGVAPGALAAAILQLAGRLSDLLGDQRCEAPAREAIALAACGDAELARALATLANEVVEDGAIDVCESPQPGLELEQQPGFSLDVQPLLAGLASNEQGLRQELDTVHVLVANEIISDFGPLARILEGFTARHKSLVVVARGIEGIALDTLAANRKGLGLHVLGLIPADVGVRAAGVLEDLAIATGATLIAEETGQSLAGMRPSMLGRAGRLIVAGKRAVFTSPAGDPQTVAQQRRRLLIEADAQRHLEYDRSHLERRASRLGGNWGELRIGGRTDWETSLRVEGGRAAFAALRAAAASGVVRGGGAALCEVAAELEKHVPELTPQLQRAAVQAVASGCRAVSRRLARNAGVEPGALIVPAHIVDPLSTTQTIVRRALSVAATMLTIEVLVC
ncbi:TCP-1/cpn60 chaperonin family protein [Pararobbsia alpina]|uniref:60 kDa chaperonin n=1 Tax=Pararobbsia alpina TaxID=621374 RepID=A0A6S7BAD0_9BURK|nr:TCP-1/cpn60 chaperonin family protein [Pararobbsia alpina]CAB3793480.1 60 kDa chaperonin 2 [Pararobbsia alpina]